MQHQTILVLDYGSQYSQLICRRVREAHVYAELVPWDRAGERLAQVRPAGIILSGGPNSVYEPGAPALPPEVIACGAPVLGICYGLQLLAHTLGGRVAPSHEREYGAAVIHATGSVTGECVSADNLLFAGLPAEMPVWMSHGDRVERLPDNFLAIAHSANSPLAAVADSARGLYGIQFHPEVVHTPQGNQLLANFVYNICACTGDWTAGSLIQETVAHIQAQVGEQGRVICGLSGGVDSAVAATLVHRAIGDRLTCVFVDHGLLRKGEAGQVVETFQQHQGMRLIAVDAKEDFLSDLAGVTDPETKRKRIGARFVRIFEAEAARLAAEWGGAAGGFSGAGHALPGRDRVRLQPGHQARAHDQNAPQRWWAAARYDLHLDRAAAHVV
jgi:GMP synthase (glutamine-hydrolysing)